MKNLYTSVFGSAILFVLVLNLTGCGGGSSESAPQIGQFIDSPVEGLRYETASQSGTTNANGEFIYINGETVTFYIGDFELGSATGAERITPFELAGLAIPVTSAEISNAIDDFYSAYENTDNNTPLNISLNMATLMQTVDVDGDPENGITIPEAFVSLMDGQTLDFNLNYWDFEEELALLIEQGYPTTEDGSDGIWGSEYREVVWAPDALDNMYSGLGLITTQSKVTRQARDSNNDGVIDYLRLTGYDAEGNRIMYAVDRDGDGTRRDMQIDFYDAQGRDIGYVEDSNGELPGGITYSERWTYFDDPTVSRWREQTYEEDNDGDGPEPMSRRIYNVNGQRIANETVADGVITYRKTFSYDSNNKLTIELIDGDGDGTGGVSERTVYTYTNNLITSKITDAGSDSPDDDTARMTYTYDANNRLLSEETDGDGAGTGGITYRVTYAYDTNGRRTLIERDADGDGAAAISFRETWQYNANGRVISHSRDNDGNISTVVALNETYEYNANSKEILYERDYNSNGIDYRRTSSYNATNLLTQQILDSDGDGTNVANIRTTVYEYDASNRMTRAQTTNMNGITYRMVRAYYTSGRQSLYQYEYDSDGIFPAGSYGSRREYTEQGRQTLTESRRNGLATNRDGYEYDTNGVQLAYSRDNDGDGPNPTYRYIGKTSLEVIENGTDAVTYREIYTINSNNHRTRTDIDADGDGPQGITEVSRNTHDSNGNEILVETRDGENVLTYRESWTYLNSYQLLSHEIDEDGDGPAGISYSQTNTYENGNLVLRETDENGVAAGGLSRTIYIYDELGNKIRQEIDGTDNEEDGAIDADGVIDSVTTYDYTDVVVNWGSIIDDLHLHKGEK